jgi:hypothetical protein
MIVHQDTGAGVFCPQVPGMRLVPESAKAKLRRFGSMHGPRPIMLVTAHNGYPSCTEDCPFWVDVMPTLPIVAIFSHLSIRAGAAATGKGNGAGRRSLVKYNQPQSTRTLKLEELKLSFSVEGYTLRAQVLGRHENPCR